VDHACDAQLRLLWVPVETDVLTLDAGETDVQDEAGVGCEEVNWWGERFGGVGLRGLAAIARVLCAEEMLVDLRCYMLKDWVKSREAADLRGKVILCVWPIERIGPVSSASEGWTAPAAPGVAVAVSMLWTLTGSRMIAPGLWASLARSAPCGTASVAARSITMSSAHGTSTPFMSAAIVSVWSLFLRGSFFRSNFVWVRRVILNRGGAA
jgi:hypothetical protein